MPDALRGARRSLDIALIASLRHGLREPQAGGLERHTSDLAHQLRADGHRVVVFASGDADPDLQVEALCPTETRLDLSPAARRDVSMLSTQFMEEHHAYLHLMLDLQHRAFDVVHDNSLHHLPVAMAGALDIPVVKVLHTPPTPWLESALHRRADNVHVVSVSQSNARRWRPGTVDRVILNGVDLTSFTPGPGIEHRTGAPLWSGRIVPEKGTDDALRAARLADVALDIAGPIGDARWFEREVRPLLDDRRRHLGHLDRRQLARRLRQAPVAVVTPQWDEPYGLVVAEALACGTPVVGYARGALPELVADDVGALVPAGDITALADVLGRGVPLDPLACRRHAERVASLERMTEEYVRLYTEVMGVRSATVTAA